MCLCLRLFHKDDDSACTVSVNTSYPGDTVDNDCDGDIDEDECYGNIHVWYFYHEFWYIALTNRL